MIDEDDKIQLGKLQEKATSLEKYLGAEVQELKEACKSLHSDLVKKNEELKECFYISETIKNKVESFIIAEHSKYQDLKDRQDSMEKMCGDLIQVKNKLTISWIQALITTAALIFGALAKMGVL